MKTKDWDAFSKRLNNALVGYLKATTPKPSNDIPEDLTMRLGYNIERRWFQQWLEGRAKYANRETQKIAL